MILDNVKRYSLSFNPYSPKRGKYSLKFLAHLDNSFSFKFYVYRHSFKKYKFQFIKGLINRKAYNFQFNSFHEKWSATQSQYPFKFNPLSFFYATIHRFTAAKKVVKDAVIFDLYQAKREQSSQAYVERGHSAGRIDKEPSMEIIEGDSSNKIIPVYDSLRQEDIRPKRIIPVYDSLRQEDIRPKRIIPVYHTFREKDKTPQRVIPVYDTNRYLDIQTKRIVPIYDTSDYKPLTSERILPVFDTEYQRGFKLERILPVFDGSIQQERQLSRLDKIQPAKADVYFRETVTFVQEYEVKLLTVRPAEKMPHDITLHDFVGAYKLPKNIEITGRFNELYKLPKPALIERYNRLDRAKEKDIILEKSFFRTYEVPIKRWLQLGRPYFWDIWFYGRRM